MAPILAQGYLEKPSYYGILIGGSNIGELLGALTVMIVGELIPTPIPWMRLRVAMLSIVWYLPFHKPTRAPDGKFLAKEAWKLVPVLLPISIAFATSDVSLTAHIQSSLEQQSSESEVPGLAAVTSVLYCIYIALFAIITPLVGIYADKNITTDPHKTVLSLGAYHYTAIIIVLLGASFIPQGALSWNPRSILPVEQPIEVPPSEDVEKAEPPQLRSILKRRRGSENLNAEAFNSPVTPANGSSNGANPSREGLAPPRAPGSPDLSTIQERTESEPGSLDYETPRQLDHNYMWRQAFAQSVLTINSITISTGNGRQETFIRDERRSWITGPTPHGLSWEILPTVSTIHLARSSGRDDEQQLSNESGVWSGRATEPEKLPEGILPLKRCPPVDEHAPENEPSSSESWDQSHGWQSDESGSGYQTAVPGDDEPERKSFAVTDRSLDDQESGRFSFERGRREELDVLWLKEQDAAATEREEVQKFVFDETGRVSGVRDGKRKKRKKFLVV